MLNAAQSPVRAREIPTDVAAYYVPVIRRTALRIARRLPSHVCVDDLVSAGLVGLVEAYRRYDPSRCDRFEAYAEMRIKGAMLDDLSGLQRTLTSEVLAGDATTSDALMAAWLDANRRAIERARGLLNELETVAAPDSAMLSVALRELRNLAAQ